MTLFLRKDWGHRGWEQLAESARSGEQEPVYQPGPFILHVSVDNLCLFH